MKKILIVDSCKTLGFFYKKELACDNRIVITSTCKDKNLKLIKQEKPALIIMDNMLSTKKQRFLLRKIRKNYKKLPVILHSFNSGHTANIKDLFLTKSSNLSELQYKTSILLETQNTLLSERVSANKC